MTNFNCDLLTLWVKEKVKWFIKNNTYEEKKTHVIELDTYEEVANEIIALTIEKIKEQPELLLTKFTYRIGSY